MAFVSSHPFSLSSCCGNTCFSPLKPLSEHHTVQAKTSNLLSETDTSTCALVLIMAHSVPSLSDSIDIVRVQEAWEKCEKILSHMGTFSQSARTSLRFLQAAFSQYVHGRSSSMPISNVELNSDRNLTGEADTHYPAPDGPNTSSFQDTPGLDSSNWTDSGIGPNTFEDDLGLLSWIDVPDMWHWHRVDS